MASRSVALAAIAGALALAAPAQAQAPVTLRIVFPEGFSVRQMTDRVAEVRKIAIRKRGVTPRLTGGAYKAAAGPRAARRASSGPFLKRRSVEGFLFPSLYEFTQDTRGLRARRRTSSPPSSRAGAGSTSAARARAISTPTTS